MNAILQDYRTETLFVHRYAWSFEESAPHINLFLGLNIIAIMPVAFSALNVIVDLVLTCRTFSPFAFVYGNASDTSGLLYWNPSGFEHSCGIRVMFPNFNDTLHACSTPESKPLRCPICTPRPRPGETSNFPGNLVLLRPVGHCLLSQAVE